MTGKYTFHKPRAYGTVYNEYNTVCIVQILLRLRRGDAVEPVPVAGRADPGHGHAVRLGGADGVPHVDGELAAAPRCASPAIPPTAHSLASDISIRRKPNSFYLFLGVIRRQF